MDQHKENLTAIAEAIREKEGSSEPIVANTFPERIRGLETVESVGEPMTQQAVYKATRPRDWLTMPEPEDNEMYLLFHIPDGMSNTISFTVNCTGEYTVALGTVEDGAFTGLGEAETLTGGTKYEKELFAENYGHLTSEGFRQAMVKVSGETLTGFALANNSSERIVEFTGRMSMVETISVNIKNLQYFSLKGQNRLEQIKFKNPRLICIPELDTSGVTNMDSMFTACDSMVLAPKLDVSHVLTAYRMYYNCTSLAMIPALNFQRATKVDLLVSGCAGLRSLKLDPTVTGWAGADMRILYLTHSGIVALLESLPAVTESKTITLSGCPGAGELTEEEKAIATGKNWTLVTA